METPRVLDLIGHTPMVEITRFDTGTCRLFVKLESQNPGGSIKDRIAREMIAVAEADGRLKPGGTIIEATAGNTGLGLALIGRMKGYRVVLVVPDKMAREKISHCKALGADVVITRSDVTRGHPAYYQDVAKRIAAETGGFYVDQFTNPANPAAHEKTTAPEIWEQMEHDLDAVVCGVGSGGTLTGLGRYFTNTAPHVDMVLADPVGSILEPLINRQEKVKAGSWLVEGIGEDFVPDTCDLSYVKAAYAIDDAESLSTARELLVREGILAGSSSGTLFAAALKFCRAQTTAKRVVTLICDRGDKYLSKTFNDFWMSEQGFGTTRATGTAEDLIVRRHDCGDTVVVRGHDTLLTAYGRMRASDVSRLPVLDDAGHLTGVIDERILLDVLARDPVNGLKQEVAAVQSPPPAIVTKETAIADVIPLLQRAQTVMVTADGAFFGIVTPVDMVNHLYLQGRSK